MSDADAVLRCCVLHCLCGITMRVIHRRLWRVSRSRLDIYVLPERVFTQFISRAFGVKWPATWVARLGIWVARLGISAADANVHACAANMGARPSLPRALLGALALAQTTDALQMYAVEDGCWRCGPNDAPAGYATLTAEQSRALRTSLASRLWGTHDVAGVVYQNYDRPVDPVRVFNDTVAQNPAEYPTERVIMAVGAAIGFAPDAEVFPVKLTTKAYLLARERVDTPLPHNKDERVFCREAIGKLPTTYNFDSRNSATFVGIAHGTHTDGSVSARSGPTLVASHDLASTVAPPWDDNEARVLTYFRLDRYLTGPALPREHATHLLATVLIAEPHNPTDGVALPVRLSVASAATAFADALRDVDAAIDDIYRMTGEEGVDARTCSPSRGGSTCTSRNMHLGGFFHMYREHRHAFLFSSTLDDRLRDQLHEHFRTNEGALANTTEGMKAFMRDGGSYPIRGAAYAAAFDRSLGALEVQLENGKQREETRRSFARWHSAGDNVKILLGVGFITVAWTQFHKQKERLLQYVQQLQKAQWSREEETQWKQAVARQREWESAQPIRPPIKTEAPMHTTPATAL